MPLAPQSDQDLQDLESRLQLTLPEDYKAFLRENNGGRCLSGGMIIAANNGE